jgi:hypothetical protein
MNDQDPRRESQTEAEPSTTAELTVVLWVLAALMAEIVVTWWWFARIYPW